MSINESPQINAKPDRSNSGPVKEGSRLFLLLKMIAELSAKDLSRGINQEVTKHPDTVEEDV